MEVDEDPTSADDVPAGQPPTAKRRKREKLGKPQAEAAPPETEAEPPRQPKRQKREKPQTEAADDAKPKRPRLLNDADEGRTIFVRNVKFSTEADALRAYFEASVGPVEGCYIVRDRQTEHSRGQAFVKFRAKSDADACLLRAAAAPDAFRLEGAVLHLCLAVSRERLGQLQKTPPAGAAAVAAAAAGLRRPSAGKRNLHLARVGQLRRGSREAEGVPEAELALRDQLERRAREALRNPDVLVSPTRLCVHALPRDTSDLDLRRAFQRLGGPGARVTECRIMRDTGRLEGADARPAPGAKVVGRSRGFAFVAFGDHEHALRAVEAARTGPALPNGRRLIVQFSLERLSALKKRRNAVDAATATASASASGSASAVVSHVPKPAGALGGVPRAPKRRDRDRGAAASGAERKREARADARRQKAGRLSRKEYRRKRRDALVQAGRLRLG